MKVNFVSTGKKFPYLYYIGVISALKHCQKVILHILEEPEGEYFKLLKKDKRLTIKPISIDKTLPVFKMDFYNMRSIANMEKNWRYVMMFDYLIWSIVSKEGGVIMGLDSITLKDWQDLLPKDKEILVPKKAKSVEDDFTMHGVVVKKGSKLAQLIMSDINKVMKGQDIKGKHRAIIDGKYRWGGAGMVPYINRVIENKDKVEVKDLSDYTVPMFSSSFYGVGEVDEFFIAFNTHSIAQLIRESLTEDEWNPFKKDKWKQAQKWEKDWHGLCTNTLFEEEKQIIYAQKMGLEMVGNEKTPYVFNLHGASILDIGGGPNSILLKCSNPFCLLVVDPLPFPKWVKERYKEAGIKYLQVKGEDLDKIKPPLIFDEVWIYNLLQHTENPEKVIENAKKVSKLVRIFEWLGTPISDGHINSLTAENLDKWLGGRGKVEIMDKRSTIGTAYYGIFPCQ
jgi:hypothetical protein